MLEQILYYLHNWFVREIYHGTFEVQDGKICCDFLQDNQYFRIIGSMFNDGLHQYGEELKDETFDGTVWALVIPPAVISISDSIQKWQDKYGDVINSPYVSESFSGSSYSYNKRSSGSGSEEEMSWQTVFENELSPYRKLKEVYPVQPRQFSPDYHRPFNPDMPWRT